MVAVALAGVVLGGGAGAGVAALAGQDDAPEPRRPQIVSPGDDGFPGWGRRDGQDGPPPGRGQLVPPGTAPRDQEDGSPSDGTSGSTSRS